MIGRFFLALMCGALALGPLLSACAGRADATLGAQDVSRQNDLSDPRNRARTNTELAALYYEQGKLAVALEVLRTAVSSDADYAPAHGMFGLVYMSLKENTLAQESFERALRLAPTDPDTQHNYAWFLCQTKRYVQAQDYFMRAIANPLYSRAWKTWSAAGECALANQQIQEATRYFESALRLQPDEPVALLQLAELRYRAGIVEQALALLQRLHARNEPTAASLWLAVRIERRLQNQANQNNYADQLRRRFPSSTESQQLQRGVYD